MADITRALIGEVLFLVSIHTTDKLFIVLFDPGFKKFEARIIAF